MLLVYILTELIDGRCHNTNCKEVLKIDRSTEVFRCASITSYACPAKQH